MLELKRVVSSVDDLIEFLEQKMAMSHSYQPLLIKSLVESGGTATIRQFELVSLNVQKLNSSRIQTKELGK